LVERLAGNVEFVVESATINKRQGINIKTLRQKNLIARPENLLIANNVSRAVAGLWIEKQYARYGTPIAPVSQKNTEIKNLPIDNDSESRFDSGFIGNI